MGFMHFWQPSTLCFDPVRFHICIVVLWRINLLFSLSRSVQFSGETPGGLWAHVEYLVVVLLTYLLCMIV